MPKILNECILSFKIYLVLVGCRRLKEEILVLKIYRHRIDFQKN